MKDRIPKGCKPVPRPAYDERDAADRLHRLAQRWQWRARGGDPKAQATARVLTALSWALLDGDEKGLAAQGEQAARYLEALRVRYDLHLDPFARSALGAYERLLQGVERQLSGEVNDEARQRAAQWFVVLARDVGFRLSKLPEDDEEAVALLVRALRKWRHKTFADAQDQAESWTRCMAEAGGRLDAGNATKHRQKKRGPAK